MIIADSDADQARESSAQEFLLWAVNPIEHYAQGELERYIKCFLDWQNSLLYLFAEDEVMANLYAAYGSSLVALPKPSLLDTYFALSIGCQLCDDGCEDTSILWDENGKRLLDNENWNNDLWAMRAMCLISIYHIG